MVTDKKVEQLLERITHLENRIDELEQENKELKQANQQLRKENKRLRAKLRWYEGPHTPPSKDQSDQEESSSSGVDEDDEQPRTDGGTPGRKSGHDPEWRDAPDPDREIEVTCDCCPDCGEVFDESAGVSPRLVEELPDPQPPEVTQYNRHHYECHSCGAETVASHPDCPDEGQFGVNVIAQAALSRYDHRLPYRKIGDRFEQLHGLELSGASAWHSTERAARAGRCEYEQIRRQIQQAGVVHVDETGIKRDGEQAWIWTFTTEEHTLYAVRESRGSDVPAEVLGEDFAGTVVCDGWTAYPAFSSNLQRCWAHILREAEDAADKQVEGEPIYRALKQLYVALQTRLESDLTVRERAELQLVARRELESLIERSVPDGPVATLLGKIEGGLDHWLTFIGEPAVSPTNNSAENALREPVVLRKIIGTLRNDRGMFVHETLLSLLAPCRQQGRNPYGEFKRVSQDNEMIPRAQTVPAVESSG
ncbi:IS66-like element ISHwa10 family transposase [Haloquadratum walsbyi]|uniref:ISH10-type transposase ISHwa10 n=1 Tax=Haloquadratum walsbyi (strain DSM 16854 / JCM 12705 / C23) TaxID=768065 RepID=G0LIW5_HALWC|nr:IS66-like element ISHwa10 family transposase [Haloquadratum walsbyi]CCC40367.1 ISH10-type transposase ISHwa10 [Haloquadratum walsbyi C23]